MELVQDVAHELMGILLLITSEGREREREKEEEKEEEREREWILEWLHLHTS